MMRAQFNSRRRRASSPNQTGGGVTSDPNDPNDPNDFDIDPTALGQALLIADAANPGELVDCLRDQLLHASAAVDLTLHLVDYRLMSLRPIQPHGDPGLRRPESVEDSALGEAFRWQRSTRQQAPVGLLHHVPVSVRGQRLGVLTGAFADAPSESDLRMLRSVARAAAHSLLEAGAGTDAYEIGRRHGSMSVSAELQWQLLPARAYRTSDFYVAGHLEPALRVAGDAFDFVVNDATLTVAVIDATATDAALSLIPTLAITALRNARRAGLSLAEQASLASDMVWQHRGGGEHVAALLLQFDARTGRATAVDAGSPRVLKTRGGRVDLLELEEQTPLGMFGDTTYTPQDLDLSPGDRIYVVTDGAFSDGRTLAQITDLLRVQQQTTTRTAPESIRVLVTELTNDGQDLDDDIAVVCVDWNQ